MILITTDDEQDAVISEFVSGLPVASSANGWRYSSRSMGGTSLSPKNCLAARKACGALRSHHGPCVRRREGSGCTASKIPRSGAVLAC